MLYLRIFVFTLLFVTLHKASLVTAQSISRDDWPCWRGPNGNGIANPNQSPPLKWDEKTNIAWKAPIPGKGHGSPTVLDNQVFITAADLDRDMQSVICLDRQTGKQKWEAKVHQGGLKTKGNKKQNKKASLASTTVATDGTRLFVNFLNQEAVWTTALTRSGEIIWQKKISNYIVHQGYGSSPTLYKNLVIVSADNKGGGMIKGLNMSTGETVWQYARPKKPNYPSPVILKAAGKTQLILTGCDRVTSLVPETGEKIWEVDGATTECVSSTVTDGTHIYTSGGYPKNHISAVVADGSGKVAWQNNSRVYVPSMLCHEGHLFAVLDAGVAVCYDSKTGEEKWKSRLSGNFSGSPIMVGDKIFATNEKGETFVFSANPKKFESFGKNRVGDSVLSTPAICGNRIYLRAAKDESGNRQEYLYCIGK